MVSDPFGRAQRIDHSHHHPCQGPLRSVFSPGQGSLDANFALPDVSLAPI